jgi:hypothetical protein
MKAEKKVVEKKSKKVKEEANIVETPVVENSTVNGEFIYETNGIKYKKIFKDGVIVERVRI